MKDRTFLATLIAGLMALGSLVAITLLSAVEATVPGVLEDTLLLSVGAVIAAAGVATTGKPSAP